MNTVDYIFDKDFKITNEEYDIFKAFYTTKESCTGLGLAICSKIMSTMNGTISLEYSNANETSFKLSIPNSRHAIVNEENPSH